MTNKKFTLWHSLVGTLVLVVVEALLVRIFPVLFNEWIILVFAVVGSVSTVYIATEIIEEVRSPRHMLVLLSMTVIEFVLFFTFQYWFLLIVQPASFPALASDPVSLLLGSTMVFVFNPIYTPVTNAARALLLINTLSALGLVLFLLQNVWQIRSKKAE